MNLTLNTCIRLLIVFFACGCQKKNVTQAAGDKQCAWNNCPTFPSNGTSDSSKINVHLVCHTHDDAGWIVNVDEYFSRLRPEMIPIGVEFIFNTVLIELERDSTKRFSFAETAFLTRWVESHGQEDVDRLKKLILNGQIELISGGWVQPDEAASHYIELIDQYTLGLRKLNDSYGECGVPKVAWQIDPFGHSLEHANIAVGIGYEALFFSRMHYLERFQRIKDKSLEFIWGTSSDFKMNQILTGQFWSGTYAPPQGFCFDALCKDQPIVTDPKLQGYNVHEKVNAFVDYARTLAAAQRHRNVMLTMGGDFQYSDANMVFTNIDKLVKYGNAKSGETGVTFRYSTPSCYVKALSDTEPKLPQRTGDTFPHATGNHSYWTGYFTSKPVLKGLIRASSNYLQLIRILDAFALFGNQDNSANIEKLERAVSLSQHHDAVTGTSKENVTADYERRLVHGLLKGQTVLQKAIQKLSNSAQNTSVPQQYLCLLTNESICPMTRVFKKLALTVYNSLSKPLSAVIRVPYYYETVSVKGPKGAYVEFELKKTFVPKRQFARNETALYELQFPVDLPALGFTTFFISRERQFTDRTTTTFYRPDFAPKSSPYKVTKKPSSTESPAPAAGLTEDTSISNGIIQLTFSPDGRLRRFTNLQKNWTRELSQEFLYYESKTKAFLLDQASGAYIFRPDGAARPLRGNISVEVVTGKFVQEVRQVVSPWISQVVRLYANQSHVEFDWIVGPILKEQKDPIGKEIITRYTVPGLKSQAKFFTDSNGRQMMERNRDKAAYHDFETTEPVSGNYYPVPSRIQINDGASQQLTILTDRSQGGSSLADGAVELMLHRRMYQDDSWGVEEALDEPGDDGRGLVARGKHWLVLEDSLSQTVHRQLGLAMFHQPVLTYSKVQNVNYGVDILTQFSGILKPLPDNVHLLTLKQVSRSSVLLRLEHFFQNEDNLALAQPVVVDLDQIFSTLDVLSAEELLLAGNVKTGDRRDLPDSWNRSNRILKDSAGKERFTVQLKPMEIKTLLLEVKFKSHFNSNGKSGIQ